MARVKGGKSSAKRRRNILAQAKGFRFGRSTKVRMAREALAHAGKYAFAHRRDKKNDFRRLCNVRLGAALHAEGLSYSKFIGTLKKKNIALNRKMLSELASTHTDTFKRVLAQVGR